MKTISTDAIATWVDHYLGRQQQLGEGMAQRHGEIAAASVSTLAIQVGEAYLFAGLLDHACDHEAARRVEARVKQVSDHLLDLAHQCRMRAVPRSAAVQTPAPAAH